LQALVQHTPLEQEPDAHSKEFSQGVPAPHAAEHSPPQSTPTSFWFFSPSSQAQRLLTPQPPSPLHALPSGLPSAVGAHVPLGTPVRLTTQASHFLLHDVEQHTPSTQ
jgi:hypothetical protein